MGVDVEKKGIVIVRIVILVSKESGRSALARMTGASPSPLSTKKHRRQVSTSLLLPDSLPQNLNYLTAVREITKIMKMNSMNLFNILIIRIITIIILIILLLVQIPQTAVR